VEQLLVSVASAPRGRRAAHGPEPTIVQGQAVILTLWCVNDPVSSSSTPDPGPDSSLTSTPRWLDHMGGPPPHT
jgi:hypothetical protein